MAPLFDRAFTKLLGHEGGYVDHPSDPGGATNWGVTIGTLAGYLGRPVTKTDVRALSQDTVKAIYRKLYWDAVGAHRLEAAGLPVVAYLAFDAAVNCGTSRSAKWVQAAAGVTQDGAVGPATVAACVRKGSTTIAVEMLVKRLFHHLSLTTWPTFGLGWARRIIRLPFEAVELAA